MAEAPATTTRPSRARKTAPAKVAPAKPAVAKTDAATPATEATPTDRFTVAFEHNGTTKNFERFDAPKSMKGVVVGSVYVPIGTQRVGVVVIGVEAPAAE